MADLASRITKPAPPQVDGAVDAPADGVGDIQDEGPGLLDSNFDVEVKLSELQADTDHPLSNNVSSFQELGLYATDFPNRARHPG